MALLLSRKLHEVVEIHTSDGIIKVWVAGWEFNRTLIAVDAPATVSIKRDNMKKEKV